MAKSIAGKVYLIESGRATARVVDASEAFRDSDQAAEQARLAERSGYARQRPD